MERLSVRTYLDLFDAHCSAKPDSPAVQFRRQSLTYSALSHKANRLANFLIKRGAQSETLIGVSAERSLEMVIAILAIHRLGAAYVPLDPAYPSNILRDMIEDAGLKLILSTQNHDVVIPRVEIKTVNLTRMAVSIDEEGSDRPACDLKPDGLAYVMYTSGSTGRPKGVMVTHSNLLNFVRLVPQVLPFMDHDIYLQSASMTYAVSVRQIFAALSHGLMLVVASALALQDPIELFKLIRDEKITLVDFVPSHWWACQVALKGLPEPERTQLLKNHLRRIVTVGEPLLSDLPREWIQTFHHPAEIVNIFGQTETTGLITSFAVHRHPLDFGKVVSIGRPIPETQTYIVDPENITLINDGDIGELCVSNACVAKGYWNNPGLTAAKFVPHPFDKHSGYCLYRTGDLARVGPDGNIEYLGRGDQQVKVRGMRVELGEIEAVLRRSEAVSEAVVVPQTRAAYGKILVAFLTARDHQEINVDTLKSSAKTELPAHMVPALFIILPELPRNPSGKIDRKALMEWRIQPDARDSQPRAVLDSWERKLLAIWKKVLKIDSIKTTDNFFDDLGGDSLLSVLLFFEIEREFGRGLPISHLYRAPTIEKLAKLLEHEDRGEGFHSLIPIKTSGTGPPLFVVHGAGGNLLIYHDLSKRLSDRWPVYGLQSYGLDSASYPLITIEEMAMAYIREVKRIQPSGPYVLCGYCMGGTVALEMAQQLKNHGDEVAFLGLMETYNWSQLPHRSIYDKAQFFTERILFHWLNFRLLTGAGRASFLAKKLSDLRKRTKIWMGRLLSLLKKNDVALGNSLVRQSRIWKINDQACFRYRANYYDGRMTVVSTKKRYAVHSVPEALWTKDQARDIDWVILPFYPAGMLVEPFVKELAENLISRIIKGISESNRQG